MIERYRDRDTYENRFVRFVLETMRSRAEGIERKAHQLDERSIATEAAILAARCRRMLGLSFLDGVGSLSGIRGSSQVLMREPAYQLVLRLYLELLLSAEVQWDAEELRRIQEIRDVATLYEMWVFIEAVDSVHRLTGGDVTAKPGVPPAIQVDDSGLVVKLRQGHPSGVTVTHSEGMTTVYYNRSYSPGSGGDWSSWSLPLRPDVSVVHETGAGSEIVVLDAKYRVDRVGGVFAEEDNGDSDPATAGTTVTFRRDDVYKMHTYRDALPAVHTALAVFPGTDADATLYTPSGAEWSGGVGAIPLAPGNDYDPAALDQALRSTLSLGIS